MGDVFDAMNRAKQEQSRDARPVTEPGKETDASPRKLPDAETAANVTPKDAGQERASEQPSLPIADVEVFEDPSSDDVAGDDPFSSESPVSFAAARTKENPPNLPAKRGSKAPSRSKGKRRSSKQVDSLNGYSREVIVHHDRGSIITEQYRSIRTQILARGRTRRLQTHVVTSSAPEEGKSVTTLNLGLSFAELHNKNTVVIESDLRRPSFAKLLDRHQEMGMLQLLRGEAELDDVLQPSVYDNFQFITAGGRESMQSTQLLSSPNMVRILEQLKDRYDHIFIDTPPVITVTDPCIMGAMADEVLLVVRMNKTPTDVVDRAKRLLRAANCDVAGVILTHMQHQMSDYKYSNYYYGRRK